MKKHIQVGAGLKPQEFEHRVGVAVEALAAALAGAQLLAAFLLQQQGAEWRNQGPKAVGAAREFRRAGRWLRTIDRHD